MTKYMHLCLAVLVLLLAAGLWSASAFQILEETPDYVKVKFTLPAWKLEAASKDDPSLKRIDCEGGSVSSPEGFPQIVSFSQGMGIPVDGDINIEVVSQTQSLVSNVNLAPSSTLVEKDGIIDYTESQNLKAYSSNALYPALFTQKGNAAFVGNRHLIPLQIHPFQYNARIKTLQVTNEAVLIIHILGTKSATRDWQSMTNPMDEAGDALFLNNRTSQSWRKPKASEAYIPTPRTGNDVNNLQLIVAEEGIYKISYGYLHQQMDHLADSLGVTYSWSLNSVDPRYLELSDENGTVAIHFQGESDGHFDEGDYFEFYGDRHYGDSGYYDEHTAENVYTLKLTNHFGARLAVENGGLVESNTGNYIRPDAFQSTVHLEEQLIPDKLGKSWDYNNSFTREDTWFWKKITAPNLEIVPFELQYPKDSTIRTFNANICLYGLTYMDGAVTGDHRATVRLNQALVDTQTWMGQTEKMFQNTMSNSYLHNGTNYFYISLPGDTPMTDHEQILLDYADITYWREYKTSQDYIKFTKPSNQRFGLYQFDVSGFSSGDISVYKIGSSVFNSMQIEPFTLNGSAPWTVSFQDSVISNDVRYYAVTEAQKKQPIGFRADIPSSWHSSDHAADCIILTAREFMQNEGTLLYKQLWESQNHTVEIVDVQDLYDEFNHGIKSAKAIKDFVSYAYNNWSSPQLTSMLILGEGIDDNRDDSPNRKYNIIPVKRIWTYKHGATSSDNWYGCVVGDDPIPEVAISRINVWKQDQILPVAQKSEHYLNTPNYDDLWHGHITLTSGGKQEDRTDTFAQQSEITRRRTIPPFYRVSRVYTSTQTVSQDYYGGTFILKDRIDNGTAFLQFMGHGGGRVWSDYNLLNFNDVASLNNQNYPIVSSLACYCAAFDTPGTASIGEALVMQPNKGAIAHFGMTGLGYLDQDLDMSLALTEGLFDHNFHSLGEAVNFSKAKFYATCTSIDAQIALTTCSCLLGDPMIQLLKPQQGVTVSTDKDSYAVTDTMHVTAAMPAGVNLARTYVMKNSEKVINIPYDLPVNNGTYQANFVLTPESNQRKVMVAGSNNSGEYFGYKVVSVGRGLITHASIIPAYPTWSDSLRFSAHINNIANPVVLMCKVRPDSLNDHPTWYNLPLSRSTSDSTLYISDTYLSPQPTGKEIAYKYTVLDINNRTWESPLYYVTIHGPEMQLSGMEFLPQDNQLAVKVRVNNTGDAASTETRIKLFAYTSDTNSTLLSDQPFSPLDAQAQRWVTVGIDSLFTANVRLEFHINIPQTFSEWSLLDNNNISSLILPLNYHSISPLGGTFASLDSNMVCEVPAGLVPESHTSLFYVNPQPTVTALNQPDALPVKLHSGDNSIPYEVRTLDTSLTDSTGVFNNGKRLKLTFFYSPLDSLNTSSFKIYRWEPSFRKWILQGGNTSIIDHKVIFEVNRVGIYSLLRNQDRTRPTIDVNVQDQEFTVGGYISGKGIISLLLSDANGIDVVDNSIHIMLDGVEIPDGQWVKTINRDDINRIPIKYQLNLPANHYTLIIDCKDVNGNFNSREVQFIVNVKFDVKNVANYPNPVVGKAMEPKNSGRTRFTYTLMDDADDVTIKIYTVSGRLVKTFRDLPTGVGYHEFPRTVYGWDCVDESGFPLANGVYFYRIIAHKGNQRVEKMQKMAIVK